MPLTKSLKSQRTQLNDATRRAIQAELEKLHALGHSTLEMATASGVSQSGIYLALKNRTIGVDAANSLLAWMGKSIEELMKEHGIEDPDRPHQTANSGVRIVDSTVMKAAASNDWDDLVVSQLELLKTAVGGKLDATSMKMAGDTYKNINSIVRQFAAMQPPQVNQK